MNKFEELFAQYPFALTDEQVKAQTADIIAKHAAENNNAAVWKQCPKTFSTVKKIVGFFNILNS